MVMCQIGVVIRLESTMVRFWRFVAAALGFHTHNWDQWSYVAEVRRVSDDALTAKMQARYCADCGKAQTERVDFL